MNQKVIVELQGHQYILGEGEEIDVDHLSTAEGKTFTTSNILALVNDKKVELGQPYLAKVKAELKVIKHFLGPKTSEFHFKAKSHYRRHRGFRRSLSRVRLEKIILGTPKTAPQKAKPAKVKTQKK